MSWGKQAFPTWGGRMTEHAVAFATGLCGR